MKNGIFALLAGLMMFTASADQIKLVRFTVDISTAYGEIIAFTDERGDFSKFEWIIKHSDPKDPDEKGSFTAKDIREGTVFKSGLPKRFVKVWGDNFSAHNGGEINIRVPKNIVTGSKTFEKIQVDRISDKWAINHPDRDDVKTVHIIVKKALGIPIGVVDFKFLD
jgi:hypothetical protein